MTVEEARVLVWMVAVAELSGGVAAMAEAVVESVEAVREAAMRAAAVRERPQHGQTSPAVTRRSRSR
jgi:hypothetical protein